MEKLHKNNIYISPFRNYRKIQSAYDDEQKFQIIVEETDLLITIPKYIHTEEVVNVCFQYISQLRQQLKNYIYIHPSFQHSLEPILSKKNAPSIVKAMCHASKHANVGPFAAVAGSVAQLTSQMLVAWIMQKNQQKKQNLLDQSTIQQNVTQQNVKYNALHDDKSINVIVENGGDIYMFSQKERIVGILSNPTQGENIGLKIYKENFPVSICSSSSKIGHSLSFGNGDIAMVKAKNAALADALATAYCNMLKTSKDINKVIEQAQKDAQIKIRHNPFDNKELLFFLNEQNRATQTNTPDNNKGNNDENDIFKDCLLKENGLEDNEQGGLQGVFLQCDGHIGAWGEIELVGL